MTYNSVTLSSDVRGSQASFKKLYIFKVVWCTGGMTRMVLLFDDVVAMKSFEQNDSLVKL